MKIEDMNSHTIHGRGVDSPDAIVQYVMHSGGVLLQAKNDFFDVALPLATCEIRGIGLAKPKLKLPTLPISFLKTIIEHARRYPHEVVYYIIRNEDVGTMQLVVGKHGTAVSIDDLVDPYPDSQIVAQIHSHHSMGAFFSATDNAADQEFRLYGVVGRTNYTIPHVAFRLGVHGYHFDLNVSAIFDDALDELSDVCSDTFGDNDNYLRGDLE